MRESGRRGEKNVDDRRFPAFGQPGGFAIMTPHNRVVVRLQARAA
jgi:hypothetical protein